MEKGHRKQSLFSFLITGKHLQLIKKKKKKWLLTASASLMKENLLSPAWPPAITLTYSTWRSFMTNAFSICLGFFWHQTLRILPPLPSAESSKGEDWLNMETLSLGTASTAQHSSKLHPGFSWSKVGERNCELILIQVLWKKIWRWKTIGGICQCMYLYI